METRVARHFDGSLMRRVALVLGVSIVACHEPQVPAAPSSAVPASAAASAGFPSGSSSLPSSLRSPSGSSASSSATSWPELPRTPEALHALVERATTRPPGDAGANVDLDPLELLRQMGRAGLVRAISGEGRIREELARRLDSAGAGDAYLLFGTHHDSSGQIEAFRRAVGPPAHYTHLVLEQLAADGRWAGLEREAQRGVGEVVARYLKVGDSASFVSLRDAHETSDYASWKFGYSPAVLDIVATARASSTVLLPCDMPPSLKTRLAPLGDELGRLRELHCAFALRDSLVQEEIPRGASSGRRIAMLWGDAHVAKSAIRRFLPAAAKIVVVRVLGQRHGHDSPMRGVAGRLVLDDPLLVPRDEQGNELVLLLPDEHTRGDVDRVRSVSPAPAGSTEAKAKDAMVRVRADPNGTVSLGPASGAVGGVATTLRIPPGDHTYVYSTGTVMVAGGLTVTAGEIVELSFDARRKTTRVEHMLLAK